MDLIKEINSLPNYYYEFDNPPRFAILGGHSCRKVEHYDRVTIAKVRRWFDEMNRLYAKENLENEEEIISKAYDSLKGREHMNNPLDKFRIIFVSGELINFVLKEDK